MISITTTKVGGQPSSLVHEASQGKCPALGMVTPGQGGCWPTPGGQRLAAVALGSACILLPLWSGAKWEPYLDFKVGILTRGHPIPETSSRSWIMEQTSKTRSGQTGMQLKAKAAQPTVHSWKDQQKRIPKCTQENSGVQLAKHSGVDQQDNWNLDFKNVSFYGSQRKQEKPLRSKKENKQQDPWAMSTEQSRSSEGNTDFHRALGDSASNLQSGGN